jgi:hypothetical protein
MSGSDRARARKLASLCLVLVVSSLGAVRFASARARPVAGETASPPARHTPVHGAGAPPSSYDSDEPAALHVLIIGNSYTFHHALPTLLRLVAEGVPGGPHLVVDTEARGGYSLRSHWRSGQALARIRTGHYSHVVLQGHSMSALDHPDELAADAERFKQAIDAATGHTVFYATWARSPEARLYRTHKIVHSFEEMTDRVDAAYASISQRLGAGLAPVGRAFERALVQNPKLALWDADGSHPTVAGSFMAACVLYGAITGADPRASTGVPEGLSASHATLIRAVAAQSLSADSLLLPSSLAAGPAAPGDAIKAVQLN